MTNVKVILSFLSFIIICNVLKDVLKLILNFWMEFFWNFFLDWGKFDPFRRFHRNFILNKMVHQNKIRELFKSIIPNQFCIKMAKICTSGQFTSFRFTNSIPITFTKNPTKLIVSNYVRLMLGKKWNRFIAPICIYRFIYVLCSSIALRKILSLQWYRYNYNTYYVRWRFK